MIGTKISHVRVSPIMPLIIFHVGAELPGDQRLKTAFSQKSPKIWDFQPVPAKTASQDALRASKRTLPMVLVMRICRGFGRLGLRLSF